MPAILGNWKMRGLVQHIKLLLEYTGTEYTERQYDIGPAPDYDRSDWLNEKFNLGLDFPNVPYYIDGDIKITQSNAILRYIARKHNLMGKTEDEVIKADILENEAMDTRMGLVRICYSCYTPDFEKAKGPYVNETLPPKLEQFSKFFGNKKWFLGENISYVDFFLYEALDCLRSFAPTCLDKFDNLKEFLTRFEALEPIKKYMNSPRFIKELHLPMANFF